MKIVDKYLEKLIWDLKSEVGATNYPSSLDSYVTRSAGDTIQESHVNDVQDAIEAIEAKLRLSTQNVVSRGLQDADGDTIIQVDEGGSDEDKIRFDIEGTETIVFGDGTNEELAKFTNTGTNDVIGINNDNIGYAINIDTDCDSASNAVGIAFNIANAGAGDEIAFFFAGSEEGAGTVGGNQDAVFKVYSGTKSAVYYVPLYSALA